MNLLMRECLFYLGTVKEQKKIYVLLGPLIKRSSKVVHIRSLVQPHTKKSFVLVMDTQQMETHIRGVCHTTDKQEW